MKKLFGSLKPNTPYTEQNTEKITHGFFWWINFILGTILFILFFDIFIVGGAIIGWIMVIEPLTWGQIANGIYILFTFKIAAAPEWLFIIFLVLGFFMFFYAKAHSLVDPKVKLAQKINPLFVFNRTMVMIWTFGHGEDARDTKKPIQIKTGWLMIKIILSLSIGLLIDWHFNEWHLVATPICLISGIAHELITDLYRIRKY